MQYTKQKPTVPGFYFTIRVGQLSGRKYETIVKVSSSYFYCEGDNFSVDDDSFLEFAGPIPNPENGLI